MTYIVTTYVTTSTLGTLEKYVINHLNNSFFFQLKQIDYISFFRSYSIPEIF